MFDPFTAWARFSAIGFSMIDTAFRTAETLGAAPGVIRARTGMMRADASRAERAELARMAPEKLDAFSRSAVAAASEWVKMQSAFLAEAQQLYAQSLRGRPPTPAELAALSARQGAYLLGVMEASARLGSAALAPVHRTATRNARRLAR
ncbi:hypothetical protein [Sphingomonas sp.]|uniref:hypothetical protein n=1 Tax=Sphingomonas sp. TaxID=28214 RepID=UPI001B2D7B90|nr:hypothetical protein [Sphingomonas sp.]MBO9711765.1 hypothetical protein [Sphingomonas sp.]